MTSDSDYCRTRLGRGMVGWRWGERENESGRGSGCEETSRQRSRLKNPRFSCKGPLRFGAGANGPSCRKPKFYSRLGIRPITAPHMPPPPGRRNVSSCTNVRCLVPQGNIRSRWFFQEAIRREVKEAASTPLRSAGATDVWSSSIGNDACVSSSPGPTNNIIFCSANP